ncbi:MAG: DNA polymerase I [Bacilli bacterium]
MTNTLLLVDGNSILYRAFFALPLLSNKEGTYTNAVYGFTNMLMKMLEEHKPTHVLVAFDAGKTTFRHADFTDYKGGRQKTPPELSEQFPLARLMLDHMGIARYELDQYEADDIIGTLSKAAANEGYDVKVVSGDRDLIQLCSPNVEVIVTKKGISEVEKFTPDYLNDKLGLTTEQFIDMKGLMGDPSDNIPGVPGVGEKTALKLLHAFGSIDGIYANMNEVPGAKLKEKLTENEASARMSRKLATICLDAPVELGVNDTKWSDVQLDDAEQFFTSLGFKNMREKLQAALGGTAVVAETAIERTATTFTEIQTVAELPEADHYDLWLELAAANYHATTCIAIGFVANDDVFVIDGDTALADVAFHQFLADETKKKVVYDSKQLWTFMQWQGHETVGIVEDVNLMSYIADATDASLSFHEVVVRAFPEMMLQSDEVCYGKGAKWAVPSKDVYLAHVAEKARALGRLKDELEAKLKSEDQFKLYNEIERPLALILAEMEYQGIGIHRQTLVDMGEDLKQRIAEIEQNIFALAGTEFNIGSPKQLGVVLFETLGLRVVKKTKTGYSTSADVLEELKNEHPILEPILLYRQLTKLQSTYVDGLLKVIDARTGRIHTRFNQTLTATGRLSSVEPNLQNIPIRLEEGRKIRAAFVPTNEDCVILACDYSQIELRVLAHYSKDQTLVDAFRKDEDVHTRTAMDVFHVSADEVTSLMRRQAKAVNFGIIYGISDFGLANNIDVSRKEAKQFIERYFETFPSVKQFMDETIALAKRDGYVNTLYNRKRVLPEINSRNFTLRGFAERTAMNTPIQGSAADIIKLAMIAVAEQLRRNNYRTKMLLTVHDELVFEVPNDELEQMKTLIPKWMSEAAPLDVPLKAEVAFGPTWWDAK